MKKFFYLSKCHHLTLRLLSDTQVLAACVWKLLWRSEDECKSSHSVEEGKERRRVRIIRGIQIIFLLLLLPPPSSFFLLLFLFLFLFLFLLLLCILSFSCCLLYPSIYVYPVFLFSLFFSFFLFRYFNGSFYSHLPLCPLMYSLSSFYFLNHRLFPALSLNLTVPKRHYYILFYFIFTSIPCSLRW